MRASQVILVVVETFLDLTIESQELILSLGVVSLVNNSTFSLIEIHLIKRELVRVFVVDGERAAVEVFHQIADTYDQARGWVILSR